MNILIKENKICAIAEKITFGIYDEPFEKWQLVDENDNLMYYMIDGGFTLVEDVTLPSDYVEGKYFFEDGEFVLNEDWRPYVSPEKRIAQLEEKVAKLNGDAVWDEMAVAIEEGVNEV